MGLDACVHCNCFETGKLNTDPPELGRVLLMEDGSLDYQCDNLEQTMAFDRWLRNDACSHRNGILFHHYLGNISLVAFIRNELARDDQFPILLKKVVYSGTHAGDWLNFETVLRLEE